ncbi:hypothetical protein [Streptomyces sp. R35]|uniref:PknH-like extracellular domain-containing protein n=1 Tax=Streptomyces sp. R35 TaxID=3238630 RepID=A0AB39SE80_9ACTN
MRVRRHGWLLVGTVLLAYAATACGDTQSSGTAAGPSASASTTPSASAQAPLSAEELKSLAITSDEVPGNRGVSADERDPSAAEDNTFPPVSDASCQKMNDTLDAGTASAVVDQIFNWKDGIFPGTSTLASYDGTEAKDSFARLRTALKTCTDFTGVGYTGKYKAHVATEKIAGVGDESLAFRITTPSEGRVRNQQHIFVRVGQVTVYCTMLDVDHSAHFPMNLLRKQVDRLARAQHT